MANSANLEGFEDWSLNWRDETARFTHLLLAGTEPSEVFTEIARSVRELSGVEVAVVSFGSNEDSNLSIVEIEVSDGPSTFLGMSTTSFAPLPPSSVLHTPLGQLDGHVVTLTILNPNSKAPIPSRVRPHLAWCADQIRIAFDLDAARQENAQLLVVEDRDRIARDLHDVVIQRLYGAGMQLDSVQRSLDSQSSESQVINGVLAELDTTIKEIRTTIFALRFKEVGDGETIKAHLSRVVSEIGTSLGIEVDFSFQGLELQDLDDTLVVDAVAVLREALTNVAKHGSINHAIVTVRVTDEDVVLKVANQGKFASTLSGQSDEKAFDVDELEAQGHSGLSNMSSRAKRHSGISTFGFDEVLKGESQGNESVGHSERWGTYRLTWTASHLLHN